MKYLLFFLIFCLSIGQLQRINLLDNQIHLYFHDIFLILFVTFGFIKQIGSKQKIKKYLRDSVPFLPLILVGILSLIYGFWNYTPTQNFVGLSYLIRLILLFAFFVQIKQSKLSDITPHWKMFCILVLIMSYLQYFFYPNFWPLVYLGWDPHMYRVVGTFFDPTIAGTIFIFLSYTLYFRFKKMGDKKLLLGVLLFLPLIFLTYSRITYITFTLSLSYYLISTKNIRYLIMGVTAFGIILFILPRPEGEGVRLERVFSIQSRMSENSRGMDIYHDNPALGVGFNRIAYVKDKLGMVTDGNASAGFPSSFVTTFVSMGSAGALALIALFYLLYKHTLLEGRTLVVALFVASILENVFFVGFVFIVFALSYKITAHNEP